MDLKKRGADIRRFVRDLEAWAITGLARLGVAGEIHPGRVGIWVTQGDGREDKIGAIGVRVRHWVSYHGLALNVAPDLTHFSGIVPCGITDQGVTSLAGLGIDASMADMDVSLTETFPDVFGSPLVPEENPS